MAEYPYTKEELYARGPQRSFGGDAGEAAFLLGGIGTGNVSLGARGELRDWEIFNHPGKGTRLPYTFFAIWARKEDGKPVAKVMESELTPPFSKSHGFGSEETAGLPRMEESSMKGEYPFVSIDFYDGELPVEVSLEAFTPFIPLNADESGIPSAILRYRVKNPGDQKVDVTVAGSMANVIGFKGQDVWKKIQLAQEVQNEYRDQSEARGLFYTCPGLPQDHPQYGNMALMTADSQVTYRPKWLEGGWFDGIQDFWDDFEEDGRLEVESTFDAPGNGWGRQSAKIGTLGIFHTLQPGEEKVFEFILSWSFPNRVKGWQENVENWDPNKDEIIKNYYSRLFADAWEAGLYLVKHMERLEKATRDFHRALFGSTLPAYIIDAAASNITVLRSTTCFRIEDGTFLGWEGCHDQHGCCEGSCTHVWNYAQTVAFLFPELEQSMRRVEFNLETDEKGKMAFRTRGVFGKDSWDFLPATDGQMGTIIRLYREWRLSGDDVLLRHVWQRASRALDFAFVYWDSDGDFVLDSQQHNTYDIEFYGPNSLTNSMFFAALKAGMEMAQYLGDEEHYLKYREAWEKGSQKMDEMLWGGSYYIQQIEDVNQYRYQYGQGCLSDQLLGQMLAHVAGLGYVLPEEHVKKAVYSIYENNFRTTFKKHSNVQRTYALNGEKGLLLCSWPKGGRPKLPFVYSDEVWTGIEYQVAAHLIYEGFVEEGLTLVKAVRDRHDGYRRNPWNEVECGHHYARSMASWGVFTAITGFQYDMVQNTMSFDPKIFKEDFSTFWSTGKAWGVYRQKVDPQTGERQWEIEVLYGALEGVQVN